MDTHHDTIIIGAGQAGLATAHHLSQLGQECLVLDGAERVGDGWRSHWDSLRLYSPARYDVLPGMDFPGDPWHYPTKDEMADYLEEYAARQHLPVSSRTRVLRVARTGDGFVVSTDAGDLTAGQVVLATGTKGRTPVVPEVSRRLSSTVVQLHSSEYRNPAQLPVDGDVLVAGTSHSGFDIAYELAEHRRVVLAGPARGELPLDFGSPRIRVVFPVLWWAWGTVLNRKRPPGRRMMEDARHHGAPALRVKKRDLLARGVEWVPERVTSASHGCPRLDDGTVLDVSTVIWATGFRHDWSWVDLPEMLQDDGWPAETRGVSTTVPGLYFCGLAFQSSFRSMLVGGAGEDAEHVARHIASRTVADTRRTGSVA